MFYNVNSKDLKKVIMYNQGIDYIDDLVALLPKPILPMYKYNPALEIYTLLRHDVDFSILNAIQMAIVEERQGVQSTYFVLHPNNMDIKSNYYGHIEGNKIVHHPDFISCCKTIIDLGHEIGIHNDLVTASLGIREKPENLLYAQMEYFSRNGIIIKGTASHGSLLSRELGFVNYEIFSDCTRKDRETGRTILYNDWSLQLNSLKMSDFNLTYEAYFTKRDTYISESRGKWGGKLPRDTPEWAKWNQEFSISSFRFLISSMAETYGTRKAQLLIHPCWWSGIVNGHQL